MKIGILGTGVVGNAIGSKLIQLGHEVKMGSRTANNEKAVEWVNKNGKNASQGVFADAGAFGEIVFNCTMGAISIDVIKIADAKNLKGNLLFIHGTGDDNVHYQNVEMLTNELVKNGKMFQMMSYPNRTHSINEGEGTSRHLAALFTKYIKENCPPGGRTPAEINAAKSQKPFTPLP